MDTVNDRFTELIESYYKPFDEELKSLREGSSDVENLMVCRETENFLKEYLSVLKPQRILDIGTAHAYSAIFFAKLLGGSEVVTIERREDFWRTACDNIERHVLSERVTAVHGDAAEVMKEMAELKSGGCSGGFDFVFIDAAKSQYKKHFIAAEALAKYSTVFVCDNILMNGMLVDSSRDSKHRHRTSVKRMHDFLEYVDDRDDLSLSLLSCGDGLAIIKYR